MLWSTVLAALLAAAPARPAIAAEVQVAVAANFSAPMRQIAQAFERDTGHRALLAFGATGALHAQIRNGAPFDVRLAADAAAPGGVYRQYAIRFGSHLVQLVNEPDQVGPRARIFRDGASTLVVVAARDYRGLAASISGAPQHQRIDFRQAHVFSATRYGLAFDFFHVAASDEPLPPRLTATIEDAIRRRLHIGESDAANLPQIAADFSLQKWRPDFYCLRCEGRGDVGGLVYALPYRLFHHLRANIFGLALLELAAAVKAGRRHTS